VRYETLSERGLSRLFDLEIAPSVISEYGKDFPAMREAFNNWTDALCKAGYISPVQYTNYCYVGRYRVVYSK